jgi:multidrug efflux pump subunit AcrA (membrane-fusion protein)
VSGSGNIQSATELDLGFKTAGVVQAIHVHAGQLVTTGQLLAELEPQGAEVTLEQSRASLQSSEATLAQLEETGGETSTGQGSGSSGTGGSSGSGRSSGSGHPASATAGSASGAATGSGSSSGSGTATPKQSAATREANLASARAAVRSDQLAVRSDETALANTKLYAPADGTLVALSGEVGESVAASGTSKSSAASSSGSSGSGSGSAGRASGSGSSSGASSGASSSGTGSPFASSGTGSPFAVLSDLTSLELVVPLSESEVTHVHVGAPATVTIEALEGTKVAAHVTEVSGVASSNSGVVSYDVTFRLDQGASGVKPGMSASAEVVVAQQEGVNVPTRAISGVTVTVVHGSHRERRRVVTGLAGDSATIILSGLSEGEQVVLPIASSSSATSLLSKLAGRGGGLGGGLGGGGPLGGGVAVTRGGG